ncbi:hypothetical protein BE0216_04090 [Bifidobacterium eulemuris]|nr:hypothetical protein BE0216_04090 [Bifidobacterium eulemuris]
MRVYRNGVDMVADSLVGIKKTLNNGELDKLLPLVRSFGILSTVCLEMRLMAVAANNRVPKRLHSDYCTNADCEMKKLDRRFNQALDDLTETLAVHEDILTIEQYANGKEIR